MKLSYNWLKTWVAVNKNADELAHLLTMSGLEVEEIITVAPDSSNVIVAKVLTVNKHPEADRLNVTTVDIGQENPIQIVCGAPNVKPGIKVPCALPGAVLPDNFKIKPTVMRGIESNGMLCSAKELGLANEVDGLLILPEDAPVKTDIKDYLNLDDVILDVKSTPNRADCLSIKGIARELSALTNTPLTKFTTTLPKTEKLTTLPIKIEEKNACGRFVTRSIAGVNAAVATPLWIKERLERSDIRSVNFLVDIGNYVMLELGQPLHIFDQNKLKDQIVVRYAKPTEKLLCLNDKEVNLSPSTLLVADSKGPVSIAGLMGGKASAVTLETTNVLIEAAFFYPVVIAGKSREYGFGSESSYRFERGVDYNLQELALERACELIIEYAGGTLSEKNEALGNLPETKEILVRIKRAEKILGIILNPITIEQNLNQLGFNLKKHPEGFIITSPSFRFDINLEIDIIEEIARLYGYENINSTNSYGAIKLLEQPDKLIPQPYVFEKLAHLGYQEVVNYAFVDQTWEADFANNKNPIQVINPIANQLSVMRSTLIGSLINNLKNNLNRKQNRLRIFEVAKTFKKEATHFLQEDYLAVLAYGSVLPEQWGVATRKVDFYDLKNDLSQLASHTKLNFIASEHPALHPGRSALIESNNEIVGFIGELHPELQQKYELPFAPYVFEIKYNLISHKQPIKYQTISKYQPVRRDLAFIVDEKIPAELLLNVISQDSPKNLKSIQLFDVYKGNGIPERTKSLAIQLIFQDLNKTLQDKEIDVMLEKIINKAGAIGAKLRV